MEEKLNSEGPVKPGILGLLRSRASDESKISWNDVPVIVEVKAQQIKVVKQLATYARCHLSLDRRRSFSIAMFFSHRALTLRFFCFHRSGISFSPGLHLDKEEEFQSVVEHMVGILSIPDEEAFGLDLTRVEKVYRLNNRNYEIVRKIHGRNGIRGHSTVVYSLKGTRNTPARLRSRKLKLVDRGTPFGRHIFLWFLWPIRNSRRRGIPHLHLKRILRLHGALLLECAFFGTWRRDCGRDSDP
ncbi:hypothetical protein EDB84DRAFT_1115076 [Lactarius hengduanensis]|nr:hypothetical protein EDB84DRAFT_1115076 [Lactarius hengduanensis]